MQAIAVAAAYRDEWPLLVIAPSSLRGQPCNGFRNVFILFFCRPPLQSMCCPPSLQRPGPTRCTAGWG